MRIGILGAGIVAIAFARAAIKQGHEVVLSSQHADTLADTLLALGHGATSASASDAGSHEVVLLAVPWLQIEDVLYKGPAWNGRILIDATNPFTQLQPTLVLADLAGQSAGVIVTKHAVGARVVKAFNSMTMANFIDGPTPPGGTRALFVSGDDHKAKSVVMEFINSFGFISVDLGDLECGDRLQQAGSSLAGSDFVMAA